MQCLIWQKLNLKLFQILTYICSLKKVWEVDFLKFNKKYSKANNQYLKSYDLKQESKHVIYLDANNLYGHAMSKFRPTSDFNPPDRKEFELNKSTSRSWKGCVLEINFDYPKDSCKLRSYYLFSLDKIGEMMSKYQLMIADLSNIFIGNIKKSMPNFFDKKVFPLLWKLTTLLKVRIKTIKIHRALEFNQLQWVNHVLNSTHKKE